SQDRQWRSLQVRISSASGSWEGSSSAKGGQGARSREQGAEGYASRWKRGGGIPSAKLVRKEDVGFPRYTKLCAPSSKLNLPFPCLSTTSPSSAAATPASK